MTSRSEPAEPIEEMARRRKAARAAGLPIHATWDEIARAAGGSSAVRPPSPGEASPANIAVTAPFTGRVTIGDPLIARRTGDRLVLILLFPPRTKKNSKQNVATQSKAYTAFRNAVQQHIASFREQLALPLPDRPYNLAADFYTDSAGDRADLFGLLQGLADALQDAGVLSDDWYLRTCDGSRVCSDHARPRVELTITPLAL